MSTAVDAHALLGLLDQIAAAGADEGAWSGWRWRRIGGGGNNLLYRATGAGRDLAVKFTIRDSRDRAGREYAALAALACRGLALAPRPLLLERGRYAQPVVVAEWLDAPVADALPADDAEWAALLAHLAALHRVCVEAAGPDLPAALLTMGSAQEGRRRVADPATVPCWSASPLATRPTLPGAGRPSASPAASRRRRPGRPCTPRRGQQRCCPRPSVPSVAPLEAEARDEAQQPQAAQPRLGVGSSRAH